MTTKILVTGGAGYIGSVLTKKLLDKGFTVKIIDNFRYSQNSLLDCCSYENFSIIRGDCRDEKSMIEVLSDMVYNSLYKNDISSKAKNWLRNKQNDTKVTQ